ncbi:diacylglycerol/lipid kinase family protein [Treponema bryantii]|uniref:diacylglycerol/lipid kinase family protein n=1 Tax=Treponema bryantii TaxID=163 RepID=UPI0003B5DA2E|nr:diacylglycerol kinase family protein [Treponema bryantii]
MVYVFWNKESNNGKAAEAKAELEKVFEGQELNFFDVKEIKNAAEICKDFNNSDKIIIAGGDGTLSRFVNDIYELHLQNEIYFYTCGTGNDFINDIRERCEISNNLIPMNEFIKSLPVVTVNNEKHYFINGIGYGIDGYCCEEGDKLRALSDKPVNYAGIAIKGMLGKFKPCGGSVTVDGVTSRYKKIWLAPTMIGRYFGGGMKITPDQDRLNAEHLVSNCVFHDSGMLKTLMVFPSIFKGGHVSHKDIIEIKTGHEVKVEFDKPCALQIDGETYTNITSYSVSYK